MQDGTDWNNTRGAEFSKQAGCSSTRRQTETPALFPWKAQMDENLRKQLEAENAQAMCGVPLPVIAKQLGHADTRMTERHYAHLSHSYIADTIRASFPTLGIFEQSKVAAMAARKR